MKVTAGKAVPHRYLAILLFVSMIVSAPARAGTTTVRIRLIDAASGKITPAMVSITGSDGGVRLPPDGRIMEKPSTQEDFYNGVQFGKDRNWIGPVRKLDKYFGRDHQNKIAAFPVIPYWNEPVMYQTSGDFTIDLPEGRWRIGVARGNEYVPVVETFSTKAGPRLSRTIKLARWIDLPARGWWSGDVHVHHPTFAPGHRAFLLEYARAIDLHVVNALEMGHHWIKTDFRQEGFGKKFRRCRGNFCVVSGQEDPRGFFGHLIGLNITHMVRNLKTYDWYDVTMRGIHRQPGALVGFAHFAIHAEVKKYFPWLVTMGEIDFVEMLQSGQLNDLDYYDYLNLGFRLAAAAGSDVPFGRTMGEVRTYVYTGPELSIDSWFSELKKGHSFVSNGPALEFTVDGKLPGSEIEKSAGATARIEARVEGHPAICVPKKLTLVGNEGVIKEVLNPGKKSALAIGLDRVITQSQWLVAGAVCENGAVAHASPVYVIVNGWPHWSAKRAPAIIERQLASLAKNRAVHETINDTRSRGIVERLDRARDFYSELLKKMKRRPRKE